MGMEAWLREFWAPVAGSVIVLAVLLRIIQQAWQNSARGRLGALAGDCRRVKRDFAAAERSLRAHQRAVGKLEHKSERVAPGKLDEVRGLRDDARRLCEIRGDQLKIAENLLRRHIVEAFPPIRHAALRERYGLAEHADARPFTFDGSE